MLLGGIMFKLAPSAEWVPNDPSTMIVHHCVNTGQSGHNRFVTARKASHEMWLNESKNNAPVSLHVILGKMNGVAHRGSARQSLGRWIMCIMIHDPIVPRYRRSQHAIQLLRCVGSM